MTALIWTLLPHHFASLSSALFCSLFRFSTSARLLTGPPNHEAPVFSFLSLAHSSRPLPLSPPIFLPPGAPGAIHALSHRRTQTFSITSSSIATPFAHSGTVSRTFASLMTSATNKPFELRSRLAPPPQPSASPPRSGRTALSRPIHSSRGRSRPARKFSQQPASANARVRLHQLGGNRASDDAHLWRIVKLRAPISRFRKENSKVARPFAIRKIMRATCACVFRNRLSNFP